MKTTYICFFILFVASRVTGQSKGIWSDETTTGSGLVNAYNYIAPVGAYMPEEVYVHAFFKTEELEMRRIPVSRQRDQYRFVITVPDTVTLLVAGLFDKTGQLIDNNNGQGYVLAANSRGDNGKHKTGLLTAETLLTSARRLLQLTLDRNTFIDLYESSYSLNPDLKYDDTYLNYLHLLYLEKGDSVKDYLVEHASEIKAKKEDESNLMRALSIYSILNLADEEERLKTRILELYPDGKFAALEFLRNFRRKDNLSDSEITSLMESFSKRFQKNSMDVFDEFYLRLLRSGLQSRNLDQIIEFEEKLSNKLLAVEIYNDEAKQIFDNSSSQSSELDFIKILLERAVAISPVGIENQFDRNIRSEAVKNYAKVLYRKELVDSAFVHLEELRQQDQMDVTGIEDYVLYAKEVKDLSFTKVFIEENLAAGLYSVYLLHVLHEIYNEMNLSNASFDLFRNKYMITVRERKRSEIELNLGFIKAPEFSLSNLDGDIVSLSNLTGKIVVIDFWATWCRPCIEGFPDMKELVNRYEASEEVEFLFINVRERIDLKSVVKAATELMKDNNYPFNVLIDGSDEVASAYKLDVLPTKLIIDRKGEIAFMGNKKPIEFLEFEIEAAKKEVAEK